MFISIDIGGTNTRVASSKDLSTFYKTKKFASVHDLEGQKEALREAINHVTDGQSLEGICVMVPGFIDRKTYQIINLPNFPELNNVFLKDLIDDLGKYYILENDASGAAVGEAMIGAGKDFMRVGYLTLGTGVGGAFIVKSSGTFHINASEPGHQIINPLSELHGSCGQVGCLEAYCSGKSFVKRYGIKPQHTEDLEIWNDYADWLSLGIVNLSTVWLPEIIIIGGSFAKSFNHFSPTLLSLVKDRSFYAVPQIVTSEIGDGAGLVGGFLMLDKLINKTLSFVK